MDTISFSDEIESIERELEHTKQELDRLQQAYEQFDLKTQTLRSLIQDLSSLEKGEMPQKSKGDSSRALRVNEETGRPSRGARREQIKSICEDLAKNQDTFKTIEILRALRAREGELTSGMKSYTYTLMSALEKDGFVKKVGRALWRLV